MDYDSYESVYGYDWYEPTEEDYEYEHLMYENPNKVTKKMTKDYEARQKQREEDIAAMEREQLEREAERQRQREEEIANFDPFEITEMMALLTENGINFTLETQNTVDTEVEPVIDYVDTDDWSDYDYELAYSDSVLNVKVTDSKSYQDLMLLMLDLPARTSTKDVKFEGPETINSVVVPKLTEKATKQAQALATSFGRKLGKVIQCSNIHPYTPSANYMRSYMDYPVDDYGYGYDNENPFQTKKNEIIEYIYRFELLN